VSTGFRLKSELALKGDQPKAVLELLSALKNGQKHQTLLGVTGSGKTFTMAHVIAASDRPALIITPNKTLAGQLYNEFKALFPENSVEYFISYYDYYQPEAYVPATDTYIEKDASINDRIDRLRHAATISLLERRDTIVVASVSCIYGLGSPQMYRHLAIPIQLGQKLDRNDFLRQLISIRYTRNDAELARGTFRVRGDRVEIITAASDARSIKIGFLHDLVESIQIMDPLLGKVLETKTSVSIFPATHHATTRERVESAMKDIREELQEQLLVLRNTGKLLEAQRLEQRTKYDLEMLQETGYCNGIENYSRFLDGRKPGEPPSVLMDFFPEDFLLFIDESHITVPQIGGMFEGDRSRKTTLVHYGFRLPSALDNRPLNFKEFSKKTGQVIYVSATPGDYEIEHSTPCIVEQIIRPTGLIDPEVERRPTHNQVDDLLEEIKKTVSKGERVLVTTLTKKMAEKLSEYYVEKGMKARYLHSEIQTMDRMVILSDLRKGVFSVLVGINLLREGLDLPEVSLVAILEADQEGFLRSKRSLIQTFGRAARNVHGRVILYADRETKSIREAVAETDRRREIQKKYNTDHGITPQTILKSMDNILLSIYDKDYVTVPKKQALSPFKSKLVSPQVIEKEIKKTRKKMMDAAKKYHFEEAIQLRETMEQLQKMLTNSLSLGD
jgi:excinuclease ABC subunit B